MGKRERRKFKCVSVKLNFGFFRGEQKNFFVEREEIEGFYVFWGKRAIFTIRWVFLLAIT